MSDVIGLKKAKQSLTEIVVFPSLYVVLSPCVFLCCAPHSRSGEHTANDSTPIVE
jgi:hypothetical protein